MLREFDEGDVLFANRMDDSDRFVFIAFQPDDLAARTAQQPLQGLYPPGGRAEMLLEKSLDGFHEFDHPAVRLTAIRPAATR
jgi:hypothetical protein